MPRGFELVSALALLFIFVGGMLALHAPDLGQMNKLGIVHMIFEFFVGCLFHKAAMNDAAPDTWTLALALVIILLSAYRIEYHWGAVFGLGLLCRQSCLADLLFSNLVALWLGNISFSLYLSHWPLIQIYQWASARASLDKDLMAAMLVATIMAIATLLYHFVEVPSRRYLRRKMQTRSTPAFADTATVTVISMSLKPHPLPERQNCRHRDNQSTKRPSNTLSCRSAFYAERRNRLSRSSAITPNTLRSYISRFSRITSMTT